MSFKRSATQFQSNLYLYRFDENNTELFNLNRSLLEKALRKWEQKFNSSIDIKSLPEIYEYGFLPDDKW